MRNVLKQTILLGSVHTAAEHCVLAGRQRKKQLVILLPPVGGIPVQTHIITHEKCDSCQQMQTKAHNVHKT